VRRIKRAPYGWSVLDDIRLLLAAVLVALAASDVALWVIALR
jgi:hypothetical protein